MSNPYDRQEPQDTANNLVDNQVVDPPIIYKI